MLFSMVDDIGVKVVRERSAGAHRESGDDGEDRGECDSADKCEEPFAAEDARKNGRDHVAVGFACGVEREFAEFENRCSSESEEGRENIKHADDRGRPHDRYARCLCIRHGVKADEDMRQTRSAEHEAERER